MKQLQFSCTLLSDVVLSSQAATEGFHESLDYIPGAKFLGIAAGSLYNMANQQQTLDLFHNGCVRFGDAHPMSGEDQNTNTYKVPASWQYVKGQSLDGEVYLSHYQDKRKKEILLDDGKQLKQAQKGYFTTSNQLLEVEQNFSIKSAYDSKEYRAKDQQMYGYFALKKGSVWRFEIVTDKDEYANTIIAAIQGKKRLGRSGSAEYGLVQIELLNDSGDNYVHTIVPAGEAYIYAVSNLCFYHDSGNTTLQPDPVKHLLLPENSEILWEKSQVRSRKYLTWNKHRNNRDADRLIIEKGSMIAVKLSESINTAIFKTGIGAHRSEGFGDILINPNFLLNSSGTLDLNLKKETIENKINLDFFAVEKRRSDDEVIAFLNRRLEEAKQETEVDKKVNEFLRDLREKFKEITSSQWGQVRTVAKHAKDTGRLKELLFNEQFGICMTGQSEPKWRGCRHLFKGFVFEKAGLNQEIIPDLVMKIAAEMAKSTQN